jgi:catechol 2,3-dioxygenase-like lactoylglutathione lyase family enzyme
MNRGAAPREPALCGGLSHLAIEVTDADAALDFYGSVLGAGTASVPDWPEGTETALALRSGQVLAFRAAEAPGAGEDSGVHQAYRCAAAARGAIEDRLKAEGITTHSYHEDRPAEATDPCYFTDPFGNRVQLVWGSWQADGIAGIDHAGVQASDIEWEEEFFIDRLGFPVDHRVGWNTADYVRARAWAEGKEDMAPGTRRLDQRYRDIPGAEPGRSREVARPNMQIFLRLEDGVIGIFLATRHRQEPAPGTTRGTPRTGIKVDRAALDGWAEKLAGAGAAVEGPVQHGNGAPYAASLYFRDPCGNLFEFCAPAEAGA